LLIAAPAGDASPRAVCPPPTNPFGRATTPAIARAPSSCAVPCLASPCCRLLATPSSPKGECDPDLDWTIASIETLLPWCLLVDRPAGDALVAVFPGRIPSSAQIAICGCRSPSAVGSVSGRAGCFRSCSTSSTAFLRTHGCPLGWWRALNGGGCCRKRSGGRETTDRPYSCVNRRGFTPPKPHCCRRSVFSFAEERGARFDLRRSSRGGRN